MGSGFEPHLEQHTLRRKQIFQIAESLPRLLLFDREALTDMTCRNQEQEQEVIASTDEAGNDREARFYMQLGGSHGGTLGKDGNVCDRIGRGPAPSPSRPNLPSILILHRHGMTLLHSNIRHDSSMKLASKGYVNDARVDLLNVLRKESALEVKARI